MEIQTGPLPPSFMSSSRPSTSPCHFREASAPGENQNQLRVPMRKMEIYWIDRSHTWLNAPSIMAVKGSEMEKQMKTR